MNREQVLNLFLTHQAALHVSIEKVFTSYVLQANVEGQSFRAVILVHSSDYWHNRLHLNRQRPGLVICYQHDTCLPCAALALDEGYIYAPGEVPRWYMPEKRFTQRGHMVLLGQLLSGVDAGFQQLDRLPRSTRYRYLAKLGTYMQNKQGRPLRIA